MSFSGAVITGHNHAVPSLPDFGEDGFYIKDDFFVVSGGGGLGELGWGATNGGTAQNVTAAGHPGIIHRNTTASAGTLAYAAPLSGTGRLLPTQIFDSLWIFRPVDFDTDTALRVGFSTDPTANPATDMICAEKVYADTDIFAVTRAAGAQTRTSIGTPTANTWNTLRIRRIDSGNIGFSWNAGAEVSHAANIPSVFCVPFWHIINQSAVSKRIELDFFRLRLTGIDR